MKQEIELARPATDVKLRPYEHHAKYYETDQMGLIHHSNYVKWMEEARMDLMDQMGELSEDDFKSQEDLETINNSMLQMCDILNAILDKMEPAN